jgi:hypothetical protein
MGVEDAVWSELRTQPLGDAERAAPGVLIAVRAGPPGNVLTHQGGETLSERLKSLIDPFIPERVDCAAYTLAIGPEVYVTPNDQTADPTTITVRKLTEAEAFTIPPGQFAFLLTEEVVSVPADALAFISIRAKTKFRGLVNVRKPRLRNEV